MRILIVLFGFFSMFSTQVAGKALDELITTDADAMCYVRDISKLRQTWSEHLLLEDFNDASLGELFASIFSRSLDDGNESGLKELMEELGLDDGELSELFPGQFALVIYNLPELLLQKVDRASNAILADFAGSPERLDELMERYFERKANAQQELDPAIEYTLVKEHFMGEALYFHEVYDGEESYTVEGYALVDGVFILAGPESRLRALVESTKVGNDAPIRRNAAYRRAGEEAGRSDVRIYFNFESIMPPLNEALLKQAVAGGMAMFGVSGKSLEAALSLETWQSFSVDCTLNEDSITLHSAVIYREKSGILELLAYEKGAMPTAHYVPDDVLSSTVARFDLAEMFVRLEALLGVASPSTPALIDIQLEQIKTKTGIDLRNALLENFGSEFVSFSIMPEERRQADVYLPAQQVYVLKVKDANALSGAFEALKDMVPGARAQIKSRDFQGETIHTVSGGANPSMPEAPVYDFSYVVTRTDLIFAVGQTGLIQGIITAMQSQDAGFWQKEEIRMLVERIGKSDVVSRTYTDFGQTLVSLLESISGVGQFTAGGTFLDPSEIPSSVDIPWHTMTETYEASDGIFSHMIMVREEEER